jgi:hypothetical protein
MSVSKVRRLARVAALAAVLASQTASAQQARMDPDNPTCPPSPNWSALNEMRFTVQTINGKRVLLAEGQIDAGIVPRLQVALRDESIEEIWLRSSGGDARAGNEAGRVIRSTTLPTRIPAGWACFSACNSLFMGGLLRFVDDGGLFIVHMFTFTSDRQTIRQQVARGEDNTIGLIGDIEQQSALLASEDNNFLIRMGISRDLLTQIMYRQSAVQDGQNRSTRRCLTQEELRRYNVVNATPERAAPAS